MIKTYINTLWYFELYQAEFFFTFSLLLTFMYGLNSSTKSNKDIFFTLYKEVTFACILLMVMSAYLLFLNYNFSAIIFNNLVIHTKFTTICRIIILLLSVIVLLLSLEYCPSRKITLFEFPILISFTSLAMLLLVSSNSLLTVYMAIELQAICSYILLGIQRDSSAAAESSLKYFILSAFSTCIMLYGCSLMYGFSGTVILNKLSIIYSSESLSENDLLINEKGTQFALILIYVGFLFKLGLAPFHAWVADAFTGGSSIVIAFFSIVSKFAVLAIFTKIHLIFSGLIIGQYLILFCILASVGVAVFSGLRQTNIKRFLAYSSISHLGLTLIGLSTGYEEGVAASFAYIITYIIVSINIWSIFLGINCNNPEKDILKFLNQLPSYAKNNILLEYSLLVSMCSMAGLPPFMGFLVKYNLFVPAISAGILPLVLIVLLLSAISTFFYLRVIKMIFTEKVQLEGVIKQIPKIHMFFIVFSTLILTFFILNPSILFNLGGLLAQNIILEIF